MRTHTRQALAPLLLALALLLAACAAQTPPQPTAAPTTEAAAPTVAPTTAPAPTAASAPTSAPTAAAEAKGAPQTLPLPAWGRNPYLSGTRSADGKPTAKYWQNRSQHVMRITVAPPDRTVTASQEITYFNQSPFPLQVLFLRTYLDVHKPEAPRDQPVLESFYSDGIQVDEFKVNGEVKPWPGPLAPTLVQLQLDQPLQPNSSITFSISWRFDLADANSLAGGRSWKEGAVDATTFYLAYFYPRLAVVNDSVEWNTTLFTTGSEFADDFNDYTYEVNVPKNYVVWATGDLQNPDEVLQPTYAQRLKDSQTSDETVGIATAAEVQAGQVTTQSDTVTWKWKADNVRDIAIGLSDHYNWDAGSVVVDAATGRRAGVHGAYPDSATLYKTIVEDAKDALVFGSTQFPGVPYPYSRTSIFVGGADEEYPMMVNDSAEAPEGMTVGLVAGHEILHSWFPFYMGTDERRYPFMDEGWTTAFDYLLAIEVLGQEGADAYFQTFRGGVYLPADSYIPIILPQEQLRPTTFAFGNNQYGKAALAYLALKDLLGDEKFKAGLHEFMDRWNGKHPLPWDMFNSFNAGSGENLNWFFDTWFFSYDSIDLVLGDVAKVDGGYAVTVNNIGGLPIPFDVVVSYTDGTTESVHQTPALWRENPTSATVTITSPKEVAAVTLATGIYPDLAALNNTWQNPAAAPAATEAPAAVPPPTEELAKLRANAWQWVGYTGATEEFTVNEPGNYTLTFNSDGSLAVKADCNQAVGSYQGEGGSLTIELGPVTAAACGEGSRGEQLLSLLGSAALYRFDGDELLIELMADGGTLTFTPAP